MSPFWFGTSTLDLLPGCAGGSGPQGRYGVGGDIDEGDEAAGGGDGDDGAGAGAFSGTVAVARARTGARAVATMVAAADAEAERDASLPRHQPWRVHPPPDANGSFLTAAAPLRDMEYLEEDQSDAPWVSYKPTIALGAGRSPGEGADESEDSISLLRSKMHEILDDPNYTLALYFLQCEYGKLPARPRIPVILDPDHTVKAQVLLGIGESPSVPAIFWSSAQYFVRAVYSLAHAHSLQPAAIYANTARVRRDMTYMGAMVGWLPLDFGVWRGKNDLEPLRAEYLAESFPGVDEWWSFWLPGWTKAALTKEGVPTISFGPAPSPAPAPRRLEPDDAPERRKLSKADKIKRRASVCHMQ